MYMRNRLLLFTVAFFIGLLFHLWKFSIIRAPNFNSEKRILRNSRRGCVLLPWNEICNACACVSQCSRTDSKNRAFLSDNIITITIDYYCHIRVFIEHPKYRPYLDRIPIHKFIPWHPNIGFSRFTVPSYLCSFRKTTGPWIQYRKKTNDLNLIILEIILLEFRQLNYC